MLRYLSVSRGEQQTHKRSGQRVMWGEAENTWIVHFGEDEAKRRSHYSLQLPEQRAKLFSVVTNDRM